MKLSIVSTLYCSAPYIDEFWKRISASAQTVAGDDYEIILVNDGSPDKSLEIAKNIALHDDHLKVISLSRNFGHHNAFMAGLSYTSGNRVFLIDVDLEEPPEDLVRFWKEMDDHQDVFVIFGIQEKRQGGLLKKLSGAVFWRMFNLVSATQVPNNILTVRLMKRQYVDELLKYQEKELFLAGIFADMGFRQRSLSVAKTYKGATAYNLIKQISLFSNAVTSFSSAPLKGIFFLGLGIAIISAMLFCIVLIRKLFIIDYQAGWPSLILSIWMMGGLTMFSLGVVGIYLYKLFREIKARPLFIVEEVFTGDGKNTKKGVGSLTKEP